MPSTSVVPSTTANGHGLSLETLSSGQKTNISTPTSRIPSAKTSLALLRGSMIPRRLLCPARIHTIGGAMDSLDGSSLHLCESPQACASFIVRLC